MTTRERLPAGYIMASGRNATLYAAVTVTFAASAMGFVFVLFGSIYLWLLLTSTDL